MAYGFDTGKKKYDLGTLIDKASQIEKDLPLTNATYSPSSDDIVTGQSWLENLYNFDNCRGGKGDGLFVEHQDFDGYTDGIIYLKEPGLYLVRYEFKFRLLSYSTAKTHDLMAGFAYLPPNRSTDTPTGFLYKRMELTFTSSNKINYIKDQRKVDSSEIELILPAARYSPGAQVPATDSAKAIVDTGSKFYIEYLGPSSVSSPSS